MADPPRLKKRRPKTVPKWLVWLVVGIGLVSCFCIWSMREDQKTMLRVYDERGKKIDERNENLSPRR